MKKNVKGFTLIELLAVIVILAVIALIATPIIMGVINDAKEGAHKDAALGFGHAVETAIATKMITCPGLSVTGIDADNVTISGCGTDTSLSINYKGTKPSTVAVTYNAAAATGVQAGTVSGTVAFSGDSHNYDVATGAQTAGE